MNKAKWCVTWRSYGGGHDWMFACDDEHLRDILEYLSRGETRPNSPVHIYPVSAEITGDEWLSKEDGPSE